MLFFDNRDRKNYEKRKELLYESLIHPIKDFNRIIGQAYKAVSEKIREDDPILENLYYDKEKLLNQINKLDFYTAAPIQNVNRISIHWYEYISSVSLKLINEISSIKRTYLLDIDNELLEKIKKISPNESYQSKYNFETIKEIYKARFKNDTNEEPILTPLRQLIDDTYNLMEYIDGEMKQKNFSLDKVLMCSDKFVPGAKSGLKSNFKKRESFYLILFFYIKMTKIKKLKKIF